MKQWLQSELLTENVKLSPQQPSRTEYAVHGSSGRPTVATVSPLPFNIDDLLSGMDLPAPVHTPLAVVTTSSSLRGRAAAFLASDVFSAANDDSPANAPQVVRSDADRAAKDLAEGEKQLHLWCFDQALRAFDRGLRHDIQNVRLRALRLLTLASGAR